MYRSLGLLRFLKDPRFMRLATVFYEQAGISVPWELKTSP